jgi:hypothetical protein
MDRLGVSSGGRDRDRQSCLQFVLVGCTVQVTCYLFIIIHAMEESDTSFENRNFSNHSEFILISSLFSI